MNKSIFNIKNFKMITFSRACSQLTCKGKFTFKIKKKKCLLMNVNCPLEWFRELGLALGPLQGRHRHHRHRGAHRPKYRHRGVHQPKYRHRGVHQPKYRHRGVHRPKYRHRGVHQPKYRHRGCLLYTSPSPRDS